jgi:carbon storage regulator
MLVLTRKVSEAICVGENIRIVVVDIRGDNVRLGISAPREVIVDREEIHGKRGKPPDVMADPAIYQPVS